MIRRRIPDLVRRELGEQGAWPYDPEDDIPETLDEVLADPYTAEDFDLQEDEE